MCIIEVTDAIKVALITNNEDVVIIPQVLVLRLLLRAVDRIDNMPEQVIIVVAVAIAAIILIPAAVATLLPIRPALLARVHPLPAAHLQVALPQVVIAVVAVVPPLPQVVPPVPHLAQVVHLAHLLAQVRVPDVDVIMLLVPLVQIQVLALVLAQVRLVQAAHQALPLLLPLKRTDTKT